MIKTFNSAIATLLLMSGTALAQETIKPKTYIFKSLIMGSMKE